MPDIPVGPLIGGGGGYSSDGCQGCIFNIMGFVITKAVPALIVAGTLYVAGQGLSNLVSGGDISSILEEAKRDIPTAPVQAATPTPTLDNAVKGDGKCFYGPGQGGQSWREVDMRGSRLELVPREDSFQEIYDDPLNGWLKGFGPDSPFPVRILSRNPPIHIGQLDYSGDPLCNYDPGK